MITFYQRLLPLLDARIKRRTYVAFGVMVILAMLEGLALVLLVPLMTLLTSPDLHSNSHSVTVAQDFFGSATQSQLAILLAGLVLGTYLVKSVAAILVSRWVATLALEQEAETVKRLMLTYLRAPYRLHLERNSAELVRTLTFSCMRIFREAFVATLTVVGDFFSMILIGAILAITNVWLALAVAVYFGLFTRGYQQIERRLLHRASEKIHTDQAYEYQAIDQAFAAVKEVKVHNAEEHFANDVYQRRADLIPAYRTVVLTSVFARYTLEIAMFGSAAIIAVIAFSTQSVAAATATIGVFLAGGFRLIAPLNKVIFAISQSRTALPSVEQVYADLTTIPTDGSDAAAETVQGLEPQITVDDVTFAYKPGVNVLEHLSFEFEAGQSIGLVGGSGAGKSTLVDVLLGVLPPDSGEVRISGHPLSSVRQQWQKMIGYVPQTVVLFDDTVRANIALGDTREDINDDHVWKVLEQAQLDAVVRALPDGLDNVIGEDGVQLSGGQRQRLGVARALYGDPSIIMLDEATSALDNETEHKLTEVLEGLRGQLTTITIAHRLSTVRRCDRLLYLDHGELVAQGSFSDLNAAIPEFARLVELGALGV